MSIKYELVIYWSEEDQSFVVEVPELPGCVADGESYAQAVANAQVVIEEWIETAQELNRPIPEPRGQLMYRPYSSERGIAFRLAAKNKKYSCEEREKFRSYVAGLRKFYRIKLVVEEVSEDVLDDYGTVDTIPKRVALSRRGVRHEFVDLSARERSELGIDRFSLYNT